MMNRLYEYEVQAHLDDLRRNAAQEHLANSIRTERPRYPIPTFRQARQYLSQGLIGLGLRLHEPVSQPVQYRIARRTTGSTALIVSECC